MKITFPIQHQIRILQRLQVLGPARPAELAKALGLQISAVSTLCNSLIAKNLIHETGLGSTTSKGGRPARILSLSTRHEVVAVALIRGKEFIYCICDIQGHILSRNSYPCPITQDLPQFLTHIQKSSPGGHQPISLCILSSNGLQIDLNLQIPFCSIRLGDCMAWALQNYQLSLSIPFLGICMDKEPFAIHCGLTQDHPEFYPGAHGKAMEIVFSEPMPPYPFAGSARANQLIIQRIVHAIHSTSALLDPQAIGMGGSFFEGDHALANELIKQLQIRLPQTPLFWDSRKDFMISAGAWRACRGIWPTLLGESK